MICSQDRSLESAVQDVQLPSLDSLKQKLSRFERLSLQEWALVAGRDENGDFHLSNEEIFELADQLRQKLHPDGVVTYVVDRNVNYSNICTCVCAFCAFYRKPGDPEGYVHTFDEIFEKVRETLEVGGSGVLMQGGLHPDLPLSWYTDLLSQLKEKFEVHLHCFSPTEIWGLSQVTSKSYREVLTALKDAGLDSMPGGGGEILVDAIRNKRRSQVNSQEWLDVMEVAHEVELPTTATMMIGMGETELQRFQHLEKIRDLQDRTGGFISFIPWTFQPDNTPLGRIIPDRLPVPEYLRWMAISRLFLDNIKNLQVSWLTQGLEEGKFGLKYGANDLGSVMIEENVISPAGAQHEATEKLLRKTAEEFGFTPVKRNAAYKRLENPPKASVSSI